jgi:hypothetical protein
MNVAQFGHAHIVRVDRHADAKLTVYGGGCTKLARSEHSKAFRDTHPDVECVAAADLATIAMSIERERQVHGRAFSS